MGEASPAFKQQLKAAFDAAKVGQTFTFRRTFTDGNVALFCGVSGDYNPYHIDDTFAAETWYGRRIIPGMLTASMLTHLGGMIGFLATHFELDFLAPVYIGDTVTCIVTYLEKDEPARRIKAKAEFDNQTGVRVLNATFEGFPSHNRLQR